MGADCLSEEDAFVRENVVRLWDCGKVREDGSLVSGEVRSGASEEFCFAWIHFDANRFAQRVEVFDEPCDVLWWKEEVGVVDE